MHKFIDLYVDNHTVKDGTKREIKDSKLNHYFLKIENDNPNLDLINILGDPSDRNLELKLYFGRKIDLYKSQYILCRLYNRIMSTGHLNLITEIIDYDYTSKQDDNMMICLVAIGRNDISLIDYLISKGFDLNNKLQVGAVKHSILEYAYQENKEIIKQLIDRGADFNDDKCRFVREVSIMKDDSMIDYLLDMKISEKKMCEMVGILCESKNFEKIDKIIELGFNLGEYSNYFHYISSSFDEETVGYLIDRGMVIDKDSYHPLLFACINKNFELIEYYLKMGVRVNEQVILHVLINFDHNIIEIFDKYSIDISLQKDDKLLFLSLDEQHRKSIEYIKKYLDDDFIITLYSALRCHDQSCKKEFSSKKWHGYLDNMGWYFSDPKYPSFYAR